MKTSSFTAKLKKFFNRRSTDKPKPDKKTRSWKKITTKILLYSTGILLALILLILVFIDFITAKCISAIGGKLTGTNITVENVDISLFKGEFLLEGLNVSNPGNEEFESPSLLQLGKLSVSLDIFSLLSKDIIINDIQLAGLSICAEINRNGKFNILTVIENLSGEEQPSDQHQSEKGADSSKVWIKNFRLSNLALLFKDARPEPEINGFGVKINNISGSMTGGSLNIDAIQIDNPDTFKINEMLKNCAVEIKFAPETIYSAAPEIKLIKISGFEFNAEFNDAGKFNVSTTADSIIALAGKKENATQNGDQDDSGNSSSGENAEKSNSPAFPLVLESCCIKIHDDRLLTPAIVIPLSISVDIGGDSESESSLSDFMHQKALLLEDTCSGIQSAGKFFNNAGQAGLQTFSEVSEKTGNVFNSVTDAFKSKPEDKKEEKKPFFNIFK